MPKRGRTYLKKRRDCEDNLTRIGINYQADIPNLNPSESVYPDYENVDQLLWNPAVLTTGKVNNYLIATKSLFYNEYGEENALFALHQSNYDIDKALEYFLSQRHSGIQNKFTEKECYNFEEGFRKYGKDFTAIQKMVVTKGIEEVVSFYYLWKKTERHDVFMKKLFSDKRRIDKKLQKKFNHITEFGDVFTTRELLTLSKKYLEKKFKRSN